MGRKGKMWQSAKNKRLKKWDKFYANTVARLGRWRGKKVN